LPEDPVFLLNNFMKREFNIIIFGIGGQGIITLTRLLAEAALNEGYNAKTSEVHGLSQRGGSVDTHLRFGKEIFSPLVSQSKADLIISLEIQETLKAAYYAKSDKNTIFLINDFIKEIQDSKKFSKEEIIKELKKISKRIFIIPASKIAKEKLNNEVLAGIFLLGYSVFKKIVPLKPSSFLKAILKVVPEKYLEINKKAFSLAEDYD